ncbi:uncharacterized protein N7484_008199 [Penicillium longicatenatum]|uniref:uncharacterized protein n=1 Tax=Penicillium longicatenatum TaxID=1561947 RepID=UPI0025465A5D|nr:uncharacterized protein N7484_008199 [Penicillium longicatenatum]KAJ5640337.1 hypothetical protein N7484_008199 [Penicillium longicatenatum]
MPQIPRRRRRARTDSPEALTQADVEIRERELVDYQNECFKGAAIIRLSDFATEWNSRDLIDDGGNVTRIARILEIQGCLRLSRQYHVPVVIHHPDWQSKVVQQQQTLVPNLGFPQLGTIEGYSFIALDHRSLIRAARENFRRLGVEEPWWIADIYITGANNDLPLRDELHRTLRESFPNEHRPSDGTIYRNIRLYQGVFSGVRNQMAENYWWAVLESEDGSRKGEYLRTLSKDLQEAFDSLLPITGIWAGMSIGLIFEDALKFKLIQPIICYLRHIWRSFFGLVHGDLDLLSQIDSSTVGLIRSRAPKVSAQDLSDLENEWDKGNLFGFMNQQDRLMIWGRLKNIDYPIPTLETFFQDILFLDVGQTVMRQLCFTPPKGENTIDKVLRNNYIGDLPGLFPWEGIDPSEQLCDLWRFSLQYAFELTSKREHYRRVPRKSKDKIRALEYGLIERPSGDPLFLLHHLFALAQSYGFVVPMIENHQYDGTELPRAIPCDFPPDGEDDVEIERRSGKPFTDSVDADLFALSNESLSQSWSGQRVSAGFIRRCVFHAFFSYLHPNSINMPVRRSV